MPVESSAVELQSANRIRAIHVSGIEGQSRDLVHYSGNQLSNLRAALWANEVTSARSIVPWGFLHLLYVFAVRVCRKRFIAMPTRSA